MFAGSYTFNSKYHYIIGNETAAVIPHRQYQPQRHPALLPPPGQRASSTGGSASLLLEVLP